MKSPCNNSAQGQDAISAVIESANYFLCRTDPVRPFISGHVANSMATEVIALLHSLLTAPENLAAQTWAAAVEKVNVLSSASHSLFEANAYVPV